MFGIVHEGTQQCGIIMELCKCDAEAMFLHNASGTDSGGKGDDRKQAMQLYKVIRVGTCRALKYLHEMDCLHGNLKLSKILVSITTLSCRYPDHIMFLFFLFSFFLLYVHSRGYDGRFSQPSHIFHGRLLASTLVLRAIVFIIQTKQTTKCYEPFQELSGRLFL